jgi:hypothetical protein
MRRKTRKQINRTGKVRCNICTKPYILEEHHIRGRKIPSPNHPSNLCDICPNCHTKVHAGEIIIERWVSTTAGKELMWHTKEEESFTGNDAKTYIVGA